MNNPEYINITLVLIFSYLLGSIPWALVIGKVFYNTDIRKMGSGNLGGSNAGRVLGKEAGISVIALDILKSFVSVAIGATVNPQIGALCGIVCTFGHCYPIFANFKGGKAVASSVGFLIATCLFVGLNWWILIISIAIFFLTLYLTKYVSFASISLFSGASLLTFIFPTDQIIQLSIFLLGLLIVLRHRENIKRLRSGKETKITWM